MNGQISLRGYHKGPLWALCFSMFFINDIFHALGRSSVYNYADVNTLSYAHHNAETVINMLQQDCSSLLHWFHNNQMRVNPHKFQAISFSKRGNGVITDFKCGMTQVKCQDYVVLFGIEIDHMLTFNDHITDICKTSAWQLAVLNEAPRPSSHSPRESIDFLNHLFRQILITAL